MSAAFQLTGTMQATGRYGLDAYGTAPYSGSLYPAYDLPSFHLGSDEITESRHRFAGEVVHQRYGVTVSQRLWTVIRRWDCNLIVTDGDAVDDLQTYFDERVFKLLPTGDPNNSITVRWAETEFAPTYLKPDTFAIKFQIEEVPT